MTYRKDPKEKQEDDYDPSFTHTLRAYIHVPITFTIILTCFLVAFLAAVDRC